MHTDHNHEGKCLDIDPDTYNFNKLYYLYFILKQFQPTEDFNPQVHITYHSIGQRGVIQQHHLKERLLQLNPHKFHRLEKTVNTLIQVTNLQTILNTKLCFICKPIFQYCPGLHPEHLLLECIKADNQWNHFGNGIFILTPQSVGFNRKYSFLRNRRLVFFASQFTAEGQWGNPSRIYNLSQIVDVGLPSHKAKLQPASLQNLCTLQLYSQDVKLQQLCDQHHGKLNWVKLQRDFHMLTVFDWCTEATFSMAVKHLLPCIPNNPCDQKGALCQNQHPAKCHKHTKSKNIIKHLTNKLGVSFHNWHKCRPHPPSPESQQLLTPHYNHGKAKLCRDDPGQVS